MRSQLKGEIGFFQFLDLFSIFYIKRGKYLWGKARFKGASQMVLVAKNPPASAGE